LAKLYDFEYFKNLGYRKISPSFPMPSIAVDSVIPVHANDVERRSGREHGARVLILHGNLSPEKEKH
jgi:hypothetical protein